MTLDQEQKQTPIAFENCTHQVPASLLCQKCTVCHQERRHAEIPFCTSIASFSVTILLLLLLGNTLRLRWCVTREDAMRRRPSARASTPQVSQCFSSCCWDTHLLPSMSPGRHSCAHTRHSLLSCFPSSFDERQTCSEYGFGIKHQCAVGCFACARMRVKSYNKWGNNKMQALTK